MNNNNDKTLNLIPRIGALIFGALAFFMVFAPNILMPEFKLASDGLQFSGLNVAFGMSKKIVNPLLSTGGKIDVKYFSASIMILTYLLALGGAILAILDIIGVGGKVVPIIACICFCSAAVMFFCIKDLVILNAQADVAEFFGETNLQYGFGALLGGISCIIAGVSSLASIFTPKEKAVFKHAK